jgi:hypothetical protein
MEPETSYVLCSQSMLAQRLPAAAPRPLVKQGQRAGGAEAGRERGREEEGDEEGKRERKRERKREEGALVGPATWTTE